MSVRLTVKGREHMLKLVAGEIPLGEGEDVSSINFTNMAIGSGGYTSAEVIAGDITNLKNIIVTTTIGNTYTDTGVDGNSQLYLDATFENNNVPDTFEIREVGVFALDEDDNEYLYSYDILADNDTAFAIMQANTTPQYMPISLDTGLSDINQANLSVQNDLAIVNKHEFDRFKIDVDNKDIIILNVAKTYTDDEFNRFEIAVDNKDTIILSSAKSYADTEDANILRDAKSYTNTSVSSKANSSHSHSLTSSNISGVLHISKGGTGNSTGNALRLFNRQVFSGTTSNPSYFVGLDSSFTRLVDSNDMGSLFAPDWDRCYSRLVNSTYTASVNGYIYFSYWMSGWIHTQLFINNQLRLSSHSDGNGRLSVLIPIARYNRYQVINSWNNELLFIYGKQVRGS